MTDSEYLDLAEAALADIERCCDRINDETDADIDNQRVGGMITITFPNRSQLIVNLQRPLQEIWLAAPSGGYHYKYTGAGWSDTRTGDDLFVQLTQEATRQASRPVGFSQERAA